MPGMRNATAVLERRQVVARLYLQGQMQSAISRAVGVSQGQVSYDLTAIRAAWLASLVRNFDEAKAKELAKLDLLEHEAWSAWMRSQQPREMTLTEATEGGEVLAPDGTLRPKPPTRKASVRREGQAGDPRFLERIQKCIDQRCAILGLGEEQAALKAASLGLATLLDQARQARGLAAPAAPPLAQA